MKRDRNSISRNKRYYRIPCESKGIYRFSTQAFPFLLALAIFFFIHIYYDPYFIFRIRGHCPRRHRNCKWGGNWVKAISLVQFTIILTELSNCGKIQSSYIINKNKTKIIFVFTLQFQNYFTIQILLPFLFFSLIQRLYALRKIYPSNDCSNVWKLGTQNDYISPSCLKSVIFYNQISQSN